jgi:hypothetical protein
MIAPLDDFLVGTASTWPYRRANKAETLLYAPTAIQNEISPNILILLVIWRRVQESNLPDPKVSPR